MALISRFSTASTRSLISGILRSNVSKNAPILAKSNLSLLSQRTLVTSSQRFSSSKADTELSNFLTEEIAAEKKNSSPVPDIAGFKVETDGAEVKLVKEANGEKIMVQCNVNHTVDSAEADDGSEEAPEMRSKPNFEVDIVKAGGQTLSFTCSFIAEVEEGQQPEEEGDIFAIDEVTMFEGETWSEKKYAVAGDILDGYLYDLFMTQLEERGITAQFADQLSDFCSAHEHAEYIRMLENLQAFAKK